MNPLLIVVAEGVGMRHFITFHLLLLASPSLSSSSLQHIRGCDSESLQCSIQADSSEDKVRCSAAGSWRFDGHSDSSSFGNATPWPRRWREKRPTCCHENRCADSLGCISLTLLPSYGRISFFSQQKERDKQMELDDSRFMKSNRINHFEIGK